MISEIKVVMFKTKFREGKERIKLGVKLFFVVVNFVNPIGSILLKGLNVNGCVMI